MPSRQPTAEALDKGRFMERVSPEALTGCWIWLGYERGNGYGGVYVQPWKKTMAAHRLAYCLFVGEIPEGLFVLHKCDLRMCVNPDHLYVGDTTRNLLDAVARGRHAFSSKTHCPQEHPYDEENTYVRPNGWRICRICARASRARYDRVREQIHRTVAGGAE